MKKKLLAAVFGATLLLGACGGGDDDTTVDEDATTDTPDTEETSSVDPEAVVDQSCIQCHGGNLEGGSGPDLTSVGATHSEDEIHDIIENGQGGMPPGLIEGEELDAVAKWLSEKK